MASQHICRTLLQTDAFEGRPDLVEKLLNAGADVNEQDEADGSTPLILAAERGHAAVVKLLLHRGANLTKCKTDGWSALHIAAYNGHLQVVQMLIGAVEDINWPDCQNSTPLHVATLYGYAGVIKLLLDAGAKADEQDYLDRMPLHLACRDGHREAVKLLVEVPDSSNCIGHPDSARMTPLHTAVKHGHAAIVRLLLDNGADPDVLDADNLTPIELAAQTGHLESLKCLLPLLNSSSKATLAVVLRLAAAFSHVDCCVEILLRRDSSTLEEVLSALLSLPQTESVQRLKMLLKDSQVLDTSAATAGVCADQFSMPTLTESLERAGFNEERMKCLQVRAEVQQAILSRQIADSADWSGCEARLAGSYCDGCGNSLECADGSTDMESDIDLLLLDKSTKPIHIAPFCKCPAVSDEEKMAYEDGHVRMSGVASNPTKYYGPSQLKPAMDIVAAQYCCCYPIIALLQRAQHFPKHVLTKLEAEVHFPGPQPSSCHVVSAAAPDKKGQQKRISTAFLESIVMKSLTTVQCWFFVTLKYLVKHVISVGSVGLKTYHVKTLLFQALDSTPPEQWRQEKLRGLLVTALESLEKAARAMQQGNLKLMEHFFLPDAALYLKDSSCPSAIAESTRSTINRLDEMLSEFASILRPQHVSERIIFHPLLNLALIECHLQRVNPVDEHSSTSLSAISTNLYNAMIAVNECVKLLSKENSSGITDHQIDKATVLIETIGDCAIAARICLKVLFLLRRGRCKQAREELLHLLDSSNESDWTSSGVLTPENCRNANELSQQLVGKNYIAKFCCRLDDEYQLDTDALSLPEFNYKVFPAHLANHIYAFYVNFNALAIYLAAILFQEQFRSLRVCDIAMRMAEDPDADLQEIFLALNFCHKSDKLVGIAHRHRSVIGREPELQRAMQDRISHDKAFEEASIEKACCVILSEVRFRSRNLSS